MEVVLIDNIIFCSIILIINIKAAAIEQSGSLKGNTSDLALQHLIWHPVSIIEIECIYLAVVIN